MKSSHKKSNRMLIGAGIFLAVYLLASVIFGTVLIDKFSNESVPNGSFTHVTVWRNY